MTICFFKPRTLCNLTNTRWVGGEEALKPVKVPAGIYEAELLYLSRWDETWLVLKGTVTGLPLKEVQQFSGPRYKSMTLAAALLPAATTA